MLCPQQWLTEQTERIARAPRIQPWVMELQPWANATRRRTLCALAAGSVPITRKRPLFMGRGEQGSETNSQSIYDLASVCLQETDFFSS
jgi:hypothetical protein